MGGLSVGDACFEVASGVPWNYEDFIAKAAALGHPSNFCKQVPKDIKLAIQSQVDHTPEDVVRYRLDWCRRWLRRAAELGVQEKENAANRHPSTSKKRLKLTKEFLSSLAYEDVDVLQLLRTGSTLAGEVEASFVFQAAFKPCITIIQQLEAHADKRNKLVLRMTKSSGSEELDAAVLRETREEIERGWADGNDIQEVSSPSRKQDPYD